MTTKYCWNRYGAAPTFHVSAGRRELNGPSSSERRYVSLTAREREVFALITTGLLNKQAAAELGIAERTIKVHRGKVTREMGAESVAALVRMAATLGIHAAAS
ncbi:MAG: response regulator transcription factor [Candidatus Binataceae bacterium]